MSKITMITILSISSINLLPNIVDLNINSDTNNYDTESAREPYAMLPLLLLYHFEAKKDLVIHGSF